MNYEKITSRQNPLIVRLSKLSDKKARDAEGLFRLDGVKLFSEAKKSGLSLEYVFATPGMHDKIGETFARVFEVTGEVLSKLTDEKAPQGIVAFAKKFPTLPLPGELNGNFRALLLSSVRDPGNLGTIVRSAAAFGFDRLILSDDCADLYHPRTLRGAMGALFRVKAETVTDFASAVTALRASGRRVYAAELRDGAVSADEVKPTAADCFVIGNEGHGIPPEISALCTGSVFIPIAPTSESLNAATAASILAYIQR